MRSFTLRFTELEETKGFRVSNVQEEDSPFQIEHSGASYLRIKENGKQIGVIGPWPANTEMDARAFGEGKYFTITVAMDEGVKIG